MLLVIVVLVWLILGVNYLLFLEIEYLSFMVIVMLLL